MVIHDIGDNKIKIFDYASYLTYYLNVYKVIVDKYINKGGGVGV
jgi:hypothetical protein